MNKHGDHRNNSKNQFILAPAYPFSGRELLADLRSRVANEEGQPLGFGDLARFTGQSKSTVHFWFSSYRHPHLVAFMSLLERLPPAQRLSFIEGHCRILPLISDTGLVGQTSNLRDLLAKSAGLTVVFGHSDESRTLVLNAFGHTWRRLHRKTSGLIGIDIHRPKDFVAIERMRYIDERLDAAQIRDLVLSAWPKLATSKSQLLLANRVWSCVSEIRNDLLRLAKYKHVVLAEQTVPDLAIGGEELAEVTHFVTLSSAPGNAISIACGGPKCRSK